MASLRALPLTLRCAVVGAISAGVVGGVVGLVIGLIVYAPTAWFAVFELGVPAAVLGGLLGLAIGAIVSAIQRTIRKTRTPRLGSNF